MKVLFTGGGGAGNEAIWRLMSQHYDLHFADANPANINPLIPANRRHAIPSAESPSFVSKLRELCESLQVNLLAPAVDEELLPIALQQSAFLPCEVLLPSRSYIEVMLDKLLMARCLADRGLISPKSFPLDKHDLEYPFIAKPRRGRGSRGVVLVKDKNQESGLLTTLQGAASEYVAQEYLAGTEYTVQMIANAEEALRAVVPVRVDDKRGITIRARTEANRNVIKACEMIHDAVPARGVYNIQLIQTQDGRVVPFEINPRISTTFCLTIASGLDPIDLHINPKSVAMPFQEGVCLTRHWTNFFQENGNAIYAG